MKKRSLDLVLSALGLEKDYTKELTMLCFRDNTITSFNGSTAISGEVETDFEGLIHGRTFRDTIKWSGPEDEVALTGKENMLTVESSGRKMELKNKESEVEKYPEIDLWQEAVEWQPCPAEFFENIAQLKRMFASDLTALTIMASGHYLVASHECRACRIKLSSQVPFDMVFERRSIEALAGFEKERVLGVAKQKGVEQEDGVLFKFGELRVFSVTKEMPEPWDFDAFTRTFLLPDSVAKTLEYIVRISQSDSSKKADDEGLMEVCIENGRIFFRYESEHAGAEIKEAHDLGPSCPMEPIRFRMNPRFLSHLVKSPLVMAYKSEEQLAYFRNEVFECVCKVKLVEEADAITDLTEWGPPSRDLALLDARYAGKVRDVRGDIFQSEPTSEKQLGLIAQEIHGRLSNKKREMFEIGRLLFQAKSFLGHGEFQGWIEKNFASEFRYQSAYNYMRVYACCMGRPELVQHFPTTLLYKITAAGFPEELRKFIFDHAERFKLDTDIKVLKELGDKVKQEGFDEEAPEIKDLLAVQEEKDEKRSYVDKVNERLDSLEKPFVNFENLAQKSGLSLMARYCLLLSRRTGPLLGY